MFWMAIFVLLRTSPACNAHRMIVHLISGSPIEIIRIFKSISAIQLFSKFPKLKKFYSKSGSLWSKGNFISSIGNVSQETVKKYIQEQKQ